MNDLTTDTAAFNQSSYLNQPDAGTRSIKGITIGDNTTNTALLTITGTSLSIGSGGIFMLQNTASATISAPISVAANQGWVNNGLGAMTISGPVTNGANLITIAGSGSIIVNGVIGNGSGGLTVDGMGVGLTLAGANTYGGKTTITGLSTVSIGHDQALSSGELVIGGGSGIPTLWGITATRTISNNITVVGTASILGTPGIVLNGILTNSGGNNKLYLSNATLQGNIYLSETASLGRTFTMSGSFSDTVINGVIADFNGSGTAGSLVLGGATLTAVNTYSGGTNIVEQVGMGNNAAFGSGIVSLGGGSLQASGAARALANNVALTAESSIGGANDLTLGGTLTNSGGNNTLSFYNTASTLIEGNVYLSESAAVSRTLTLQGGTGTTIVNGVIANSNGPGIGSALAITGAFNPVTINAANTYSGGTFLGPGAFSGTLAIGNDQALGTGILNLISGSIWATGGMRVLTNNVVLSGASVTVGGSLAITFAGSFTNSGGNNTLYVTNASATSIQGNVYLSESPTIGRSLTVGGSAGLTISGVIADFNGVGVAGGLKHQDSSVLTLTGANAYSGTTTISGGTIQIGNGGTSGSLGTGPIIVNGNLILNRSDTIFIPNTITGTGTITLVGTGITNLTNTGSFGGVIAVSAGATLGTNGVGNISIGSLTGTGTVQNGAVTPSILSFVTPAFTIRTFNGAFQDGGSGQLAITSGGSGTLKLGGSSTYTGITTITGGGTLSVSTLADGGNASSIGAAASAAANLVIDGGTLQYTGALVTTDRQFSLSTAGGTLDASGSGTLTFSNTGGLGFNAQVGARTLTLSGSNSGANLLSATITDNGGATSILKSGSGTWALSGTNSYTGVTTVAGGILSLSLVSDGGNSSNVGAADSSSVNILLNGGVLQYTGGATSTDRLFSVGTSSGSIDASGSGAISFTNSGSIGFNSQSGTRTLTLRGTNTDSNTLSALVSDNGGATRLTKAGSGRWVLTGSNNYTGITSITGGILSISDVANGGISSNIGGG